MRIIVHGNALKTVRLMLLTLTAVAWCGTTAAQWLEGYSHRARITVHPDLVPGSNALEGFPLLFSWTDSLLRSVPNGGIPSFNDGTDIAFTGSDGATVLDYETESYDPVTGKITAWIGVPSLSGDSVTEMFLYYGNPAAAGLQDTAGVWSNQYVSVWHMHDDPSGAPPQLTDATSNKNHGTTGGGMTGDDRVEGKIATGIHFDGLDDYATMPVNGLNLSEGTAELWVSLDSLPETGTDYFFAHRQESPITDRIYLRVWSGGEWGTGMGSTYDLARGDTLKTGHWHHLAITWNGSQVTGYLDGRQDIGPVSYGGLDTIREIYVMAWLPSFESAAGILDELRVSAVCRDSAWIAASFLNQVQPGPFIQVQARPSNDSPCSAIELDPLDSCQFTVFDNIGASDSGIPDPGCGAYLGGDIWFYVIIPADSALGIQTDTEAEQEYPDNNGWMYRAAMAIYSGRCDSLALEGCFENNSEYHPRMAGALVTGQTPGDTLWVRIWENSNNDNGRLKICVTRVEQARCPSQFELTGGGSFCRGDTGVSVFLSGSEPGMLYTLLLNDTIRLDTLSGHGGSLIWSPLATAGIYKVEAEYPPDSCRVMMTDSAEATVLDLPGLFDVSGGGSYYLPDTGVSVSLSGSEPGIEYTLLLNDTIMLETLAGNGGSLTWSPLLDEGVYRVLAVSTEGGCMAVMNDSATVTRLVLPMLFGVTGGGSYCEGDTGVSIVLSGSESGNHYTLVLNDTVRLDTLSGTGDSLVWTPVRTGGVYRVEAENPEDTIPVMMEDSAVVAIHDLPQLTPEVAHISCFGFSDGSISLEITAAVPYAIEWEGPGGLSSDDQDISNLPPGDFSATITDPYGCTASTGPLSITEPDRLEASVISVSHLTRYEAGDGAITLSVAGGTPPYNVLWSGTDGFTSTGEDPAGLTVGYYSVMVTDDHLCADSIRGIAVLLEEDTDGVFIPEGFSPNGDGYNDLFVILGIEHFPDNELVVFNRQGVEVLRRMNYQNDWDGKPGTGYVLGGELPEGTYYYIFRYGDSGIRKGYVYINRE